MLLVFFTTVLSTATTFSLGSAGPRGLPGAPGSVLYLELVILLPVSHVAHIPTAVIYAVHSSPYPDHALGVVLDEIRYRVTPMNNTVK